MNRHIHIDLGLLIPVIILVIVSLTTLLSINPVFFKGQLLSLVAAVGAFFFFSQLNIDFLKQMKLPIYIVSLIILSIILFLGFESRGAIRWIDIFGIRLQFSEILKPFLALTLAAFLAENRSPAWKSFFMTILLLLPVIFLIYLQPDLGNAIIYASVVLLVLLIRGFPLVWFGLTFLPVIFVSPFFWTNLHEYQRQRFLTFLHPKADPLGASYNSIQAIIAVGSGSFSGKGLSEGTQSGLRFLPERHTDFIFATMAEGMGFIGAGIVILALLFLCYRLFVIFNNSEDLFTKIFTVCMFCFFLIQGFINIAMNMGFLPVVGVTLPFVSFGGSSLLSNFIFLGILSSLTLSERNKHVLEIK